MTDEEVNRKFDLVAEHLANIAQAQMKTDGRIDRLERIVKLAVRAGLRERRNTREKINALIAASERADERMSALAAAQQRGEEATQEKINALIAASERADERMEALAAAQERTDEQMKALAAAQKRSEEAFTAFQQQVGQALSDMAQAVTATNKRIDLLEPNGKK
jgi:uncharacterized protein YwgA